jgi:VIT1/CCC1 family predicted Fe2+/Mn2+ transporter
MGIYMGRGLSQELAQQVTDELMAHDALGAHARDELGITDLSVARPFLAAGASASSFACGALLPLAVAAVASVPAVLWAVPATALIFLAALGAIAARAGGAAMGLAAARVTFWGALAMAATAGIGELFGTIVQ